VIFAKICDLARRIRSAAMDPVVEVRDLRKSYDDVERLHGISFSVEAGQIFGFLGTNGAGKTTTIEILEGYRTRSGGEVSVLGTDPAHPARAWRNRIGLVLQESELDPIFTVRETVGIFSRYFEKPTDVEETIATVGLSDKADARIGHLSGGQKRRVDVALGLVGDPDILFLDEPTTGLDPSARREMWTMIETLRASGKTIFLTTHYMDEAEHLCDNIVILRAGSIAAQGSAEELRRSLGDTSEVKFATSHAVTAAQLIAVVGTAIETDGDVFHFHTEKVQRDLAALLHWAEEQRIELRDLQVLIPTLDDVFVHLAGSGIETDSLTG
jgi:ABC-2 type transport system ATP-binding protein